MIQTKITNRTAKLEIGESLLNTAREIGGDNTSALCFSLADFARLLVRRLRAFQQSLIKRNMHLCVGDHQQHLQRHMNPYLKGGRHHSQPVLCMWAQASRALRRSIRLVVCSTGGRGRTQEKVRTSTHLAWRIAASERTWFSNDCSSKWSRLSPS